MDETKLAALREKYSEKNVVDPRNPEQYTPPFAGIPTLLNMPYQSELKDIDIALIGVPFDLGVYNRSGARLGPKAIRNISMIGPMNHQSNISPADLSRIVDVGDVPIRH